MIGAYEVNVGYVAVGSPEDVLTKAAHLGFDGVELVFSWGGPCDLEHWTVGDTKRIQDLVAATGVRVLSVSTGPTNHLAPDPVRRQRAVGVMKRALELASALDTSVVACNAYGNPSIPPAKQVVAFGEVFGEYARRAEGLGVRIAIENCPHVQTEHGIQIGNIAYSPEMFERLFAAVPSRAVGMEYDPSHYCWLGIDYLRVIHEFADRLVFMHAKDCKIGTERLGWSGIYGSGWWQYCVPGMGDVDWGGIADALTEVGYQAGVVVELEDPAFEGERFDEGLTLGLRFLQHVLNGRGGELE